MDRWDHSLRNAVLSPQPPQSLVLGHGLGQQQQRKIGHSDNNSSQGWLLKPYLECGFHHLICRLLSPSNPSPTWLLSFRQDNFGRHINLPPPIWCDGHRCCFPRWWLSPYPWTLPTHVLIIGPGIILSSLIFNAFILTPCGDLQTYLTAHDFTYRL